MKIKIVENFSIEECREYLNTYPNGSERTAVEDRLNAILQQKRYREEHKEKQRKLEQERLTKDVMWIDIRQFLAGKKYKNLLMIKILVVFIFIFSIFQLLIFYWYDEVFFLDSYWYDEGYTYLQIIYTLYICCIMPLAFWIVVNKFHSPSLHRIYNIESEEKIQSYRRTQDKWGMWGLHLCKKYRIVQILPFKYDNIYYCGGKSYICVIGNKFGVYSTVHKKMVLKVEYDFINIMQDGTLETVKNGVRSKVTTEGYRIIE